MPLFKVQGEIRRLQSVSCCKKSGSITMNPRERHSVVYVSRKDRSISLEHIPIKTSQETVVGGKHFNA